MNELWGPIDPHSWRSTPCVTGRSATRNDVVAGRAVFFIEGTSDCYPIDLPACATVQMEDGSTGYVVVIQAEAGPEGVYLGVRPLSGGNAIMELDEVELQRGLPT